MPASEATQANHPRFRAFLAALLGPRRSPACGVDMGHVPSVRLGWSPGRRGIETLAVRPRKRARDLSWSPDTRFSAYSTTRRRQGCDPLWLKRLRNPTTHYDGRSPAHSAFSLTAARSITSPIRAGLGSVDQNLRSDGRPGDPQRLPGSLDVSAALSDDGSQIAYTREQACERVRIHCCGIEPPRGRCEQLTSDEAFVEFIDVTPTARVGLSSDAAGTVHMRLPLGWRRNAAVTSDPTPDWRPWLSGRQTIVFYAYRTATRAGTIPLAGGPADKDLSRGWRLYPCFTLRVTHRVFGDSYRYYVGFRGKRLRAPLPCQQSW